MSVPRLRFKEFGGAWEALFVGGMADTGIIFDPVDGNHGEIHPKASDYVASGIPFVMANDIRFGRIDFANVSFITEKLARTLRKGFAIEGDVLLTHKGTVGEVTIIKGLTFPFLMLTPQVTYYRVKDLARLDATFLARYFQTQLFQKKLSIFAGGGTRAYIGIIAQRELRVALPTLPEQKKIAAFLGVVDAKIAALRARVLGLQGYKRGLMQALFSQTLRFTQNDGTAFPDWEEKRLGDLGKFTGGGTPDTENPAYWIGDIPWVSSSDIREGDLSGPQISRWITEQALRDSATKIVPANSILIVSRVGVGKLTVTLTDVCTSQDFTSFTPTSDNVRFLGYWLLSNVNTLLRLCQGTSIKGLTSEDLKAITLYLPHPDEQAKIAEALSAMDAKIAAVQGQVSKMQDFKKGLLQQMFV